jgi:hypothetical protein
MSHRAPWSVLPFLLLSLFAAAAAPLRAQPALAGTAIELSPPPANFFYDLAMAPRPDGGFIAVWQDGQSVQARGYDARGRATFPVRSLGEATGLDVAPLGSGFVVVGFQERALYPLRLARIYDAAGKPQGKRFVIETPGSSPLSAPPRVVADGSGGFVVAWVGNAGVFLRRFSSQGVPQEKPRRVVRTSGAGVCCIHLARGSGGEILAVWLEQNPWLVWGQVYLPSGEALGIPFPISGGTSFREPAAIAVGDGFLVAWHGRPDPTAPESVQGRVYDRTGSPRSEIFAIATGDNASFSAPVLAADAHGRAWAVWLGGLSGLHAREVDADGSLGPVQGRPSVWPSSTPLAAAGWGDGALAMASDTDAGLRAQRLASGTSPGVVGLAVERLATAEGAGPLTLKVERREGTLGAVTVDYAVRAESAADGVDFSSISGTVSFADGDSTAKVLTVPVLDDALAESDETFRVELSNPGGGALLGPIVRTRVEIRDDDVPSPLLQNAGGIFELDSSYTVDRTIRQPLVAALAGGGFVALWESHLRFDDLPFLASRIFDAEGRQIGGGLPGVTWADGQRITAQPGGGFTIVNGEEDGTFGRRFSAVGQPLAERFPVPWGAAAITAGRSGGLLALWARRLPTQTQEISLIAYGGKGNPLGPPRIVQPSPACGLTQPALASDRSGRGIVVWSSASCRKIFARRTDALGRVTGETIGVLPPGAEIDIGRIAVAAAPDGRFVVVWEGSGDGDGWGIFARAFGTDDRPLGPAFQVNSHRVGYQVLPRVAMQGDGRFLVIWQGPGEVVARKLFGQYYAADGRRVGSEFPIDSEEPNAEEIDASLAVDANGRYVVAWRRYSGDTINARRLMAP